MSGWLARFCGMLFLCYQLCLPQSEPGGYHPPGTSPDTLRPKNNASISLDKSLDTYHWTGLTAYDYVVGPWSLQFSEQFLSMLINTTPLLIRDEQTLNLFLKHRLTDGLQSAFQVSSYSLSDNQSVGIGSASSHAFYAGAEFEPFERLALLPMVGYRFDNQLDQHDRGVSYQLGISSDSLTYGGYRTGLNGKLEYDKLDPRALETRNLSLVINKDFFEQTRNLLRIQYIRNRRDFYDAADTTIRRQYGVSNNIETRTDDSYAFSDILDYTLGRSMLLSFQGNVISREITRQLRYEDLTNPRRPTLGTTIDELTFDGGVQANYTPGGFLSSSLKFFYQERDEQHTIQPEQNELTVVSDSLSRVEERKNNHARRTLLALNIGMAPSHADSVALSAATTLLRYDTPTELNDDQRDELRYILSLAATHRFNRYFNIQLLAEADLTHLVYLLATRSADNTWNRIFRLSPRVAYVSGGGISSVNTFEVLANYTVYDFEYSVSPIRSFAFRQFGFIDSSTVELTRRLAVEWFSQIRLYERGELRWQEFSERPLNYFEDKTYIGTMQYRFRERLVFSLGIRYFSQSRFSYQGTERLPDSFLRSIGPITGIRWNVGQRTELFVKGWYENQSLTGQPGRSFTNVNASFTVLI